MERSRLQNSFPWRVFLRFVFLQVTLVLVALIASGVTARYFFKRQFIFQAQSQMHDSLVAFARDLSPSLVQASAAEWCRDRSPNGALRFTLIARDGRVLCDSLKDARRMENHATRPEVMEALEKGSGNSVRYSTTLHEQMIYGALAIDHNAWVLRGAVPLTILEHSLRLFDTSLTLFLLGIAALLTFFAIWEGRRLVSPMSRLIETTGRLLDPRALGQQAGEGAEPGDRYYGEWSAIESSMEEVRKDLRAKLESLTLQREEQATLMSAISDAIIAVDTDESPLFYNSRFALTFASPGVQANRHLWEIFRAPEILKAFRSALRDGKTDSARAVRIDSEEGTRFFSVSVSPLRKSNGQIYGAVGVFHDVTDLKRAEQIRIDFVANVSHELRTPLTAIKGYADTLVLDIQQGRVPEKNFVDVITRNTDRLMSLINDLLDLSSLESSENFQKTPVDTREFTQRVLRQMEGQISSKQQAVAVQLDAPVVLADSRRLEQVLVNLLDNARKYTPVGGKISVHWFLAPAAAGTGDDVCLAVSDTGPGISPEHHTRLFERFYRVDRGRSREMGGTGLGLAIVKHIMQGHGGTVSLQSRAGEGSTFLCRFPSTLSNGSTAPT